MVERHTRNFSPSCVPRRVNPATRVDGGCNARLGRPRRPLFRAATGERGRRNHHQSAARWSSFMNQRRNCKRLAAIWRCPSSPQPCLPSNIALGTHFGAAKEISSNFGQICVFGTAPGGKRGSKGGPKEVPLGSHACPGEAFCGSRAVMGGSDLLHPSDGPRQENSRGANARG